MTSPLTKAAGIELKHLKKLGVCMRVGLLSCALVLCSVSIALADPAHASIRKDTNIPPEGLNVALQAFAKDFELQVLYHSEIATGLKSQGAIGSLTPDEALTKVLDHTGLSYKFLDANTITVFASSAPSATLAAAGQDQNQPPNNERRTGDSSNSFRVASLDQTGPASAVSNGDQTPKKDESLTEIVVTGSRLSRSSSETALEVVTYSRAEIERSGQSSVAEFLNTIPAVSQSYGEGPQSYAGTTTVQLHGLPVGTTLILVNGNRVERSLGARNFFDLNNIPIGAIDRIEIVPAGSSAIYGSDAIAGVVNIILRQNLNSAEASVRYGRADGIDDRIANLSWGHVWDHAALSVIGTLENRGDLSTTERALTSSNDYRAFGGANTNGYTCAAGNVYALSGNLPGVGAPYAAVPPGFKGSPSQAEFAATANTLNQCPQNQGASLIPATHRLSAFVQGHVDVTSSVQLYTEFLFSHIQQYQNLGYPNAGYPGTPTAPLFTVSADNPFNPFGETVGVSGTIPGLNSSQQYDTVFIRPLLGLRADLSHGWKLNVTAYSSEDRDQNPSINVYTNGYLATQAALNSSNPTSALNPFVDGAPISAALRQSLESYVPYSYKAETWVANGYVSGPLVTLPSGPITLALGAEYERDSQVSVPTPFSRNSHAVFAETQIPIVGNKHDGDTGARLAASLAARYDSYSDAGSKTSPQFGLVWRPADGLLLRASYAKSFAAPPLSDLHSPQETFPIQYLDPANGNQLVAAPTTFGGNPNLQPQTGKSRSFGLVYNPTPELRLSVTRWSIDQNDSIQFIQPQVLVTNANLFPGYVVRGPGGQLESVFDPYGTNFGALSVAGLDYEASYAYHSDFGVWSPSISITQTTKYSAALVPGAPLTDRLSSANDDGNWAPRWKATIGGAWEMGPYSAHVTERVVGSYRDYDPLPSGEVQRLGGMWLTDMNLRYGFGSELAPDNEWVRGASFEFGAVNLFNRLPQFSNFMNGQYGYDPSQSDIRGRFLYVQLSWRF